MRENNKQEKISNEINGIIQSRGKFIKRHYLQIRQSLNNYYEWPELDPLRHEICLCIMFGLCQAAITLTNHLLESLLKYALIINHSQRNPSDEDITGKTITLIVSQIICEF